VMWCTNDDDFRDIQQIPPICTPARTRICIGQPARSTAIRIRASGQPGIGQISRSFLSHETTSDNRRA
jgi:hypothetical protein